jgi:hypothetical protein
MVAACSILKLAVRTAGIDQVVFSELVTETKNCAWRLVVALQARVANVLAGIHALVDLAIRVAGFVGSVFIAPKLMPIPPLAVTTAGLAAICRRD